MLELVNQSKYYYSKNNNVMALRRINLTFSPGEFIAEIFITTTISTVVGFFLMMILLIRAQSEVAEYIQMFRFTFLNVSIGVLAIYGIQTIFGLQILSKYDI